MSINVVCFGEVLWDLFPTHKKIGGAPLNVAMRLNALGVPAEMVSAIGNDILGEAIVSHIHKNDVNTSLIQKNEHATGQVTVQLDQTGNASYTIDAPVAWDFIRPTQEAQKAVMDADALLFGSLASRNTISRETLFQLTDLSRYNIFDVNLRPPHYAIETLRDLIYKADIVKFNEEELKELCDNLGIELETIENGMKLMAEFTQTSTICVTRGSQGAILYHNGEFYTHPGYHVNVKDTVGAGDSFLASLVAKLLANESPQESLDLACAMGALVAASQGANPVITEEQLHLLRNKQLL